MSLETSKIAILLTTYNGEKYLAEQLQSIALQTHKNWHLIASDDGSSDGTHALLHAFAKEHLATLLSGPRQGFVENFMAALFHSPAGYDFFAFADHDDVWDADKLSEGIKALHAVAQDVPALYGARTRLMDVEGKCYGQSQLFKGPFDFSNALVQCFAGGNTMMLNRAAWELLHTTKKMPLVSHDWWFYQIISGAGGQILFDPVPHMNYRQHGRAIAGSSAGFFASLDRASRLLKGKWRDWNNIQVAALQANAALLTEANCQSLDQFAKARGSTLIPRLVGFRRSRIRRLTFLGNAGLLVAALFKRI